MSKQMEMCLIQHPGVISYWLGSNICTYMYGRMIYADKGGDGRGLGVGLHAIAIHMVTVWPYGGIATIL
jgi:hypothetical protein